MSTEIIRVLIHDDGWPQIMCNVSSSTGTMQRESLYDTAGSNFEPHVLNALRSAVGTLIQKRRRNMQNGNETTSSETTQDRENDGGVQKGYAKKRVQKRAKSHVRKTGKSHSSGARKKGRSKK
jgi:hypothetical protein